MDSAKTTLTRAAPVCKSSCKEVSDCQPGYPLTTTRCQSSLQQRQAKLKLSQTSTGLQRRLLSSMDSTSLGLGKGQKLLDKHIARPRFEPLFYHKSFDRFVPWEQREKVGACGQAGPSAAELGTFLFAFRPWSSAAPWAAVPTTRRQKRRQLQQVMQIQQSCCWYGAGEACSSPCLA